MFVLLGTPAVDFAAAPSGKSHTSPPVEVRKDKEKKESLRGEPSREESIRYEQENYITLSEVDSDPDLLIRMPDERTREIIQSTRPAYLRKWLQGFHVTELREFVKEEKIDLRDPPVDLRNRLISWIKDRKFVHIKSIVRSLSAEEKWLLDRYIMGLEPGRRPNFDSEVRRFEEWTRSRAAHAREERKQFPSFSMRGRKQEDVFAAMPDQHEAHYARQAHAAYIAAHPVLARLQSEGWNLDAGTPAELGHMLESVAHPLPGSHPHLFYFIDPKSLQHDSMTREISAAWERRGGSPPSYLLHDNFRQFLDELRGQTIILVGHILGTDFAMDRGPDKDPLLLDIPTLIRSAAARQVLLVPIGCNSANSGAPFGFTRPIDSVEIAKFITAIPRDNMFIGDLLAAMGAIAPIWVDVNALAKHMDIVIKYSETSDPDLLARVPASSYASQVAARYPSPAPADGHTAATTPNVGPSPSGQVTPSPTDGNTAAFPANYQQFTSTWIEAHRPWHDRGIFRWVRTLARHARGSTLFIAAAAVACFDLLLQPVRRHVDGTTRAPGTKLHILQKRLRLLWLILAAIAAIYAFWAPWLYITLGVMAVLLLFAAISPTR